MKSHLLTLLVFSALVSTVFATLLRDDAKSQLRFGIKVFAAFVGSAIVVGWLMAPFPS
jgi:galactitol-specific phosphotransferase system IIC component